MVIFHSYVELPEGITGDVCDQTVEIVGQVGTAKAVELDDLKFSDASFGYGSIPINTIFRGMNIHKSQLWLGV